MLEVFNRAIGSPDSQSEGGGQAFADSWSEGGAFPWIIFTLVEISVNGLALLQVFKALGSVSDR